MKSTLMYSIVMFVIGTNSVVPGLLAFHWLKSNRPGSGRGRATFRQQGGFGKLGVSGVA